jgi:ribosomal protein S18 acetylase RimI-like enzyme
MLGRQPLEELGQLLPAAPFATATAPAADLARVCRTQVPSAVWGRARRRANNYTGDGSLLEGNAGRYLHGTRRAPSFREPSKRAEIELRRTYQMHTIREVDPDTTLYEAVVDIADRIDQKRYVVRGYPNAKSRILLAAVEDEDYPVGFLFALVQVLGKEEGCSPIFLNGQPLLECHVEAFGVLPKFRQQGIGQTLQEAAIRIAHNLDCYQVRSRSPVTAMENYERKLKMGYTIHPSTENDSYYFIKRLRRDA